MPRASGAADANQGRQIHSHRKSSRPQTMAPSCGCSPNSAGPSSRGFVNSVTASTTQTGNDSSMPELFEPGAGPGRFGSGAVQQEQRSWNTELTPWSPVRRSATLRTASRAAFWGGLGRQQEGDRLGSVRGRGGPTTLSGGAILGGQLLTAAATSPPDAALQVWQLAIR